MLHRHCTYADLTTMSMDECEVANRWLDAWLEATAPVEKPKSPNAPGAR